MKTILISLFLFCLQFAAIGKTIVVKQTIIVPAGVTMNGKLPNGENTHLVAYKTLGDGSQKEGQKPIVLLNPGARLTNYIIDFPAADGVHILTAFGKTTRIDHVLFKDVGEDAITIESKAKSGTALIEYCEFKYATDKVIQVNGTALVRLEDCIARNFIRFARGCGTCGDLAFRIEIYNLKAYNGDTILKLTNKKARGKLYYTQASNVKHLFIVEKGAKVEVKK